MACTCAALLYCCWPIVNLLRPESQSQAPIFIHRTVWEDSAMLLRDIQRSAEEQQAAAQDMKARRRAVSRASVVRCLLCCRVLERVPGSWVRCVCSDAQVLLIMRCHKSC